MSEDLTPLHQNNNNIAGLQIEGMTCTNCALAIDRYLKKQGLSDIRINFVSGEAFFAGTNDTDIEKIKNGINKLGYQVVGILTSDVEINDDDENNNDPNNITVGLANNSVDLTNDIENLDSNIINPTNNTTNQNDNITNQNDNTTNSTNNTTNQNDKTTNQNDKTANQNDKTTNQNDKTANPIVGTSNKTLSIKPQSTQFLNLNQSFLLSTLLSLPLAASMFISSVPLLHSPVFQAALALPVLGIGLFRFGPSALGSLRAGVPNMYVLILMGAIVSFVYSIFQTFGYGLQTTHTTHFTHFYFETTAIIITLALVGKWLEHTAIQKTTSALDSLKQLQQVKAKKVHILSNGAEEIREIAAQLLKKGDNVLVNTGDRIPADGTVLSGEGMADESMISGESVPVSKSKGSPIIGGTVLIAGNVRLSVTASGTKTTLSQIIALVRDVQSDKPPIQQLADRVSAIFVPTILIIAFLTFLLNYIINSNSLTQSIMNAVAVLVVACPCAMGLAVPTALVTAVGRAARQGILIKGASTIEQLAGLNSVIFDKTGTLTDGNFTLAGCKTFGLFSEQEVLSIVHGLEKYSSHPIAISLQKALAEYPPYPFQRVNEEKGIGLFAHDSKQHTYRLGNYSIAQHLSNDAQHTLYLVIDEKLAAVLDLSSDKLKPDANLCVELLHKAGLKTVLLSGDRPERCQIVAQQLGIKDIHAAMLPSDKLNIIAQQSKQGLCAMVGDGINDAPALTKADVGISLGNATQVAVQSAKVVLLNNRLASIPTLLNLSRSTLYIIRQNLFWAFIYNALMIPLAATGRLNPMLASAAMALSSLLVILNSLRLKTKKI